MTLIDINHADPDALSNALHASSAVVAAIVARRQVHPFSDLSDLEGTVPGLNKAVLDAKKRMIFFQ
jgi:DNA uptake protein ComE-like DNA-binding protein